jgi:hypothetical protein
VRRPAARIMRSVHLVAVPMPHLRLQGGLEHERRSVGELLDPRGGPRDVAGASGYVLCRGAEVADEALTAGGGVRRASPARAGRRTSGPVTPRSASKVIDVAFQRPGS